MGCLRCVILFCGDFLRCVVLFCGVFLRCIGRFCYCFLRCGNQRFLTVINPRFFYRFVYSNSKPVNVICELLVDKPFVNSQQLQISSLENQKVDKNWLTLQGLRSSQLLFIVDSFFVCHMPSVIASRSVLGGMFAQKAACSGPVDQGQFCVHAL